jgi:hypothetical protein
MRAAVATEIFSVEIPIIGKVPMVFFVPDCSEKNDLTKLITSHGGLVSNLHECFTYQISPITAKLQDIEYFYGEVYAAHWLVDSVQQGYLIEKASYLNFKNEANRSLRIEFSK